MDHLRFDNLARLATAVPPHGRLLRLAGAVVAGTALAGGLRPRPARAALCPQRVPNYNHTPSDNGCGPEGGVGVPNRLWGVDFEPGCNGHDICYDTCNKPKKECDDTFLGDLQAACAEQGWDPDILTNCFQIAGAYYAAVALRGGNAYEKAQTNACVCCDEGDACGPNSAGYRYCCKAAQPFCCAGGCWLPGSVNCGNYCCPPETTCCGPEQKCCAKGFECRTDCASGGYACQRVGSGPC